MLYLRHVVGTDEVGTVAFRAEPLASAAVYGHGRDVETGEQIVGKIAAVVARHLDLYEAVAVLVVHLRASEHQRTGCRPGPDVPFHVLCPAVYGGQLDIVSVVIDEAGVGVESVVLRIIGEQSRLAPVVIAEPQQPSAVLSHL